MYPVENMSRARAFYEINLGLNPGSIFGDGAWVEYDLPEGGCFALTTLAKDVMPSSQAGGSVAFEVENLETLVNTLKEKGVQFKRDIFLTPVCKIAVILDSEGNAVTLHQLNEKK